MRLIGILFGGALAAVVAVQSVALYKANQRLSSLERQLPSLVDEGESVPRGRESGREQGALDPAEFRHARAFPNEAAPALGALGAAAMQAGGLAGVAAASDDPLPLPLEIASPQARQQLSSFVRAQIQKEQQEAQEQRRHGILERQTEANNALVTKLGLDPNTAGQFTTVLAQVQQQRVDVISQARQGELPRSEIREKMQQITHKSDEQIKALVGEEKFKVFKESEQEQWPIGGLGRFGGFGGQQGQQTGGLQARPVR